MAARLKLGCTGLAICLSGCGPLLYPEGTFDSGCPALPVLFSTPSDLAGTWSGTVTGTDPSTGETSDESISVTFDRFGQPFGNDDPWPAE